ncbi:MAG: hypothetical protein SVR08_00420 [Spirochaetota bacterium]|nr:hypothetical protein [Spirochaetota bacterium]
MKKSILKDDVFYTVVWSPLIPYDKYRAGGIPEMPGLICLLQKNPHQNFEYLLFYSCWRDGLRMGLKNLLDPNYSIIPELIKTVIENKIVYKYSTIDSSPLDMKDIMYWMIKEYQPIYNNVMDYEDTKRYKNIYVREMLMEDNDIKEKLPQTGL